MGFMFFITSQDVITYYPTYSLSSNVSSTDETNSVINFTITTTGVNNGTSLYWDITNLTGTVNAADFTGAISGSSSITNDSGSFTLTVKSDLLTEGTETFKVNLYTGSIGGTLLTQSSIITINDTSTTPVGPSDLYYVSVPLLLKAKSATGIVNNNNTFIDSSTNKAIVTVTGTPIQGPFGPYTGFNSCYFNGTTDYLSLADSNNWNFGSGDVTIEAWIYQTARTASSFWGQNPSTTSNMRVYTTAAGLLSYSIASDATSYITSTTLPLNQWVHIAYVKFGTTFTLYMNGTNIGSQTYTTALGDFAYPWQIGGEEGVLLFKGYMSNFRLIKGTAVYTSNFTPSTTPLTAIANTVLLLNFNNAAITDDSVTTNIGTIGSVTSGSFSPYGHNGYSTFFNGTSDKLLLPASSGLAFGTGDFTIEGWFNNTNSYSTTQCLFGVEDGVNNSALWFGRLHTTNKFAVSLAGVSYYEIGTNDILLQNIWYHIALIRQSGVVKLFINGTQSGLSVNDNLNYTGQSNRISVTNNLYSGYISNFRVVNGTAVYTSNFTPSTTPLTAITNTQLLTCQSNRFKDNSTNNHNISISGTPKIQAFNPFTPTDFYSAADNPGSCYYDGTASNWLIAPINASYAFGTNDYTYEAWIYPITLPNTWNTVFCNFRDDEGTKGWSLLINSAKTVHVNNQGTNITTTATVNLNSWNHVAASKQGTTVRVFVNGVLASTMTVTASITNVNAHGLAIGGSPEYPSARSFNGYISNPRVINGTALYTATFTPPTTQLTNVTNTKLLLNASTNTGIYDATDNTNITVYGNATTNTTIKKFNSSIYFDGTGDYLTLSSSNLYTFGTGDFTIETWIYLNTVAPQWQQIYEGRQAEGAYPNFVINYNKVSWFANSVLAITTSVTLNINTWYHVAVCRSNGITQIYVNGEQSGNAYTDTTNYGSRPNPLIGAYYYNATLYLNGYLEDFRISKLARYTGGFTPPTTAFEA